MGFSTPGGHMWITPATPTNVPGGKLHRHHYSKGWRGSLSHYLCAFCWFITSRRSHNADAHTRTPWRITYCISQGVRSNRKSADTNSLGQVWTPPSLIYFLPGLFTPGVVYVYLHAVPTMNLRFQLSPVWRCNAWGSTAKFLQAISPLQWLLFAW